MRLSSRTCSSIALLAATIAPPVVAIDLDVNNAASIKSAARTIVHGLMTYYTGNVTNTPETLAVLPGPYYWWEAGALWGSLLGYFHYTGDASYNSVLSQALLSQVGPNFDYMVPRHQKDEGNDDQAFWGFAIMAAAEQNYEAPTSGIPSWLQMTINLWNTQVTRWDTTSCNGGLRWQIFSFNNGYNYKNSVSNGAFFQLSARLARYTGNATYFEWAERSWAWSWQIGLISADYKIFDGTDDRSNCSELSPIQWTYNTGIALYGAAVMYNATNGSVVWENRVSGIMDSIGVFFSPDAKDVMYEAACETVNTCDTDQWSFKAYLSRYMWATTKLASFTTPKVTTLLSTSAKAAAKACSGGVDGTTCGAKWYTGSYDGTKGVGQQLSALETIQGLLINGTAAPFTSSDVVSDFLDHEKASRVSSAVPTTETNSKLTQHISTTTSVASLPVPTATPKKSQALRHRRKHIGALGAAALALGTPRHY